VSLGLFLALSSTGAQAAVSQPTTWTSVYESNTYPSLNGLALPIAAGSGRVLLVAIASRATSATTQMVALDYGGRALTLAQGDAGTSAEQHTYLYYLLDAGIAAASSNNLAVTVTGGTAAYTWVYAAVFAGVDQAVPFTDRRNFSSGSTASSAVGPFSPTWILGANDWPLEVLLIQRSVTGPQVRNISSWAANWGTTGGASVPVDKSFDDANNYMPHFYIAHRASPSSATTDASQHTADNASVYSSMTGVSLKPEVVTTTLGNGSAGTGATVCPGSSNQKLDGFSLQNNSGANGVTGLTVTTTGNTAIASASIWNDPPTVQYFATINNPASNTLDFSGGTNATIPVSTTAANFLVRVTYLDQASAPAGTTSTTARVSAITTVNATTLADAADPAISLDNAAPTAASWVANAAGDGSVTLNWTLGTAGDNVVIVRYPVNTDTAFPTEGQLYNAGDSLGAGIVVYAGNGTTTTDGGLTNGATYYYRVFEHDGCFNYAATAPWSSAQIPVDVVITLADGVPATDATVCPLPAARKLDGFSFASNVGTDSISALTVTLTGYTAIQSASIWNEAGTLQYFSAITPPTSNTLNFSGGTPIPVSSTAENYKLQVTYRNESQSPPAGSTTTTAYVSAFTSAAANTIAGGDLWDATITLNNVTPTPGAAWGANSAADRDTTLNWSLGTAGNSVLIVRYPNNTDPTLPTEGVNYVVGSAFGAGTVRYVGNATTFTDNVGLNNGSAYYYRIFEHDNCRNYVAGANAPWSGALTPRAVTTLGNGIAGTPGTVCPGAANQRLDGFSLQNSEGLVGVTGLTVTTTGFDAIASASLWSVGGTPVRYLNIINNPTSDTLVFSGGTALPVSTTAANFEVRITYLGHAAAPAGTTSTTAYVSALTTLNTVTGTDAVDTTVTVNNVTPAPGASWGATSSGDRQTTLSWTLGTSGNSVVVVRYTNNTDTTLPTDGTPYAAGNTLGAGTVRYVGPLTTFTDNTGLGNGTAYYYRVFESDGCLNYAATGPWTGALTPRAITTLAGGTGGTSGTVCPGAADRKLDGFTLRNSEGSVPVTAITVTTTGFGAIETASIWNDAGTTQYFATITEPTSNTLSFSGGTALPVSSTATNAFQVRITYRDEGQIPPAGSTSTTAVVTSITTLNTTAGTDAADTTVTLNNVTPAPGATWGTLTAGDSQTTLNWTSGAAGNNALIVRYTANTDTTLPDDGTPYTVGSGFGIGGTVRYAGNAATFNDTVALTNGTAYYYRLFEYDGCGNYVATAANAPWSGPLTPRAVTTLANGLPGTAGTVCPGGPGRKLDGFSLVNSQGAVPVTALTVTTTGYQAIQTAAIYDEAGGTQYFTLLTTPASNTLSFSGGTAIPVGTALANYKVVVTYRGETQSPPVGTTATTAVVSSITTGNTTAGADTADTTLTLNNTTPTPGAAWAATPAGDGQIVLNWTYGTGGNNAMVVRYLANSDTTLPTDGTPTYAVNGAYGSGGTIRYIGNGTTFTDTGLTNGTAYYYRVFEHDGCLNYVSAVGAAPWAGPLTPRATTTLANGVPGANATVCPGTANRKLDGFSLVNSQGAVGVSGLTVTVTGFGAIQTASIYDEAGSIQYFTTITTPASGTLSFGGGTPLPVGTTAANFKVQVTYRGEAQSPPAGNTATTAVVTGLTTPNNVIGTDTADATVTLNNLTPTPGTAWGANAAGDGQVTLNWTLGTSGNNVVVVRYLANSDPTLPADNTPYAVGSALGTGTVRYAGNGATFVDASLANGTTYYYRVFEHDTCLNYVATAPTAPWSGPLTPKATTTLAGGVAGASGSVCPGTANRKLGGFSLVNSQGNVPVTALTVTTTGYAAIQSASIWDEAGGAQYLSTVTAPTSNTLTFSGGTPIPVSTTAANFQVRVTYRSEAQSPPAGNTSSSAFVSALTTANNLALGDAAEATVTLSNVTPTPGGTWGANAAGDGQVFLAWNYGTPGNGAVVVRYTAATDLTLPADGTPYTAGDLFGLGGTVRYVGSALAFTDTTVANGTAYYYRLFEFDGCRNYVAAAATAPWSGVLTPKATTTLGNGAAGANATVCPGVANQKLDGFSLINSQGNTGVTGLTVTTTGSAAIQTAAIYDEAGQTLYFTPITAPASNTLVFSGGAPIPVSTTPANFKVVVTYKSEAQSPPPGSTSTTAVVGPITTLNNVIGGDAVDATVTLNNVTPTPGATWGTVTAGATQNVLNWSYGTAGDGALIVRYAAAPDTGLPADGLAYTLGGAFGTGGTVRYVGNATTFTDTGLTNGTLYYYRLFEFNGCLNYVSTAATAPCVTNCGACSSTCANPHGATACLSGVCTPTCAEGYGNYDGNVVNGCEATCDQPAHCGLDCRTCQEGSAGHTVTTSCAGNAEVAAASCHPTCLPGYLDSDLDGANGCEVACLTSALCGSDCSPCLATNATANLCGGGNGVPASQSCKPACLAGYADLDLNGADGCETVCDTNAHCGAECKACSIDHASRVDCAGPALSSAASCQPQCLAGWANNDVDGTNGCEAACETDNQCGSDCLPCQKNHVVSATCTSNDKPAVTECVPTCEEGFADLDGNGANGCELTCSEANHCGLECATCSRVNTTTVTCSGNTKVATSACQPACTPGHLDADQNGLTGCEVTCDQPEYCGTTCIRCPDHLNALVSCGGPDKEPANACSFVCEPGWTRPDQYSECDTECTTIERCGLDCMPCPAAVNAAPACAGNTAVAAESCGLDCAAGYVDADGDRSTGCEACAQGYFDLATAPPASCGKCDLDDHCGSAFAPFCRDCIADWDDGLKCVSERCGCETKADCPDEKECQHHTCVSPCTADGECTKAGEKCCGPAGQKVCLTLGKEICDGRDNDCNGTIDDQLEDATAPLCEQQDGVCAGSRVGCVDGLRQACTDAVYAAHSSDWEALESRCDGLDNDCNGKTDEPAACAVRPDAGVPPPPDAGTGFAGETYELGGCGCQQAAGPSALASLALLLGALAGCGRRSRREG
jgi:hypothetical protein